MPCEPSGKVEMMSSLAAARVEAMRRTSEFGASCERKTLARSISLELAREWTSERGATNNYIETAVFRAATVRKRCWAAGRSRRVHVQTDRSLGENKRLLELFLLQ